MRTWYVLANGTSPTAGPPARAAELDAAPVIGDPSGAATVFPSVVVVSPNASPAVFPDNDSQATLAEVQAAQAVAENAEATAGATISTAQTTIATLLGQQSAFAAQIASDAAMFEATAVGSSIQQEHIDAFVRIVNGFSTTMEAIVSHLILTGDYTP